MSQTADVSTLLSQVVAELRAIRANAEPSEFAYVVSRRVTQGVSGAYDGTADTYRYARSRSVTLCLWDGAGAAVQFANDAYPEWQMRELHLHGPAVYQWPLVTKSFRIRALSDLLNQTEYSLVTLL